jgi:hypothetical protein
MKTIALLADHWPEHDSTFESTGCGCGWQPHWNPDACDYEPSFMEHVADVLDAARESADSGLLEAALTAIEQLEIVIRSVEFGGDIPTEAQIGINALRAALTTGEETPE